MNDGNDGRQEHVSYTEARRISLVAATTTRIFGVPLHEGGHHGHRSIWWCGIGMNGAEHREPTKRIWHIPESDIVESGEASGFNVDDRQVVWFDVKRECTPVEESYTPVSLAHSARMFLRQRGFGGFRFPVWWGIEGGDGDDPNPIPVTLDPRSPSPPLTGQPPTTIFP